jgi:hypothetical protein
MGLRGLEQYHPRYQVNRIPDSIPERGPLAGTHRKINQIIESLKAMEPKSSATIRVIRTSMGTHLEAIPTSQIEETTTTTGKAYWA